MLGFAVAHPNLHRDVATSLADADTAPRSSSSCNIDERMHQAVPSSSRVNLADRSSSLLVERVEALRDAVRRVKAQHPFEIVAWVVLPDHLHAIWTGTDWAAAG